MVNVKYLKLPCKVKAVSTENEDGSYTVFLNNKLTYEQNRESYLHELRHIQGNDFDKEDINLIELGAHKG